MKQIFKCCQKAIAFMSCSLVVGSLSILCSDSVRSQDLEEILSENNSPQTLQLSDLNQSWHIMTISGIIPPQVEENLSNILSRRLGDRESSLLPNILTRVFNPFLNPFYDLFTFYSQGQLLEVNDKTYLVAYFVMPELNGLNRGSILENCDRSFFQPLSPQTPIYLTLLDLDMVTTIEDIMPLDINEVIANSVQTYEKRVARCQEMSRQLQKVRQVEARNNIGAMNRAQQAHELEYSEFANSLLELGLGIPSETKNYRYSIIPGNNAVFNYAIANIDGINSYVGGVFLVFEETDSEWLTFSIVCESDAPIATEPNPPVLQNNRPICATGTTKLF